MHRNSPQGSAREGLAGFKTMSNSERNQMHTIRTHFGGLDPETMFIYNGVVYEKTSAGLALNCHTLKNQAFKPDQLVEVLPE